MEHVEKVARPPALRLGAKCVTIEYRARCLLFLILVGSNVAVLHANFAIVDRVCRHHAVTIEDVGVGLAAPLYPARAIPEEGPFELRRHYAFDLGRVIFLG